ncbi:MAG: hypothetical protein IIZ92_11170, partial [Aquincola sp.]|nr:hypothetical protein [Aquincola sp.]
MESIERLRKQGLLLRPVSRVPDVHLIGQSQFICRIAAALRKRALQHLPAYRSVVVVTGRLVDDRIQRLAQLGLRMQAAHVGRALPERVGHGGAGLQRADTAHVVIAHVEPGGWHALAHQVFGQPQCLVGVEGHAVALQVKTGQVELSFPVPEGHGLAVQRGNLCEVTLLARDAPITQRDSFLKQGLRLIAGHGVDRSLVAAGKALAIWVEGRQLGKSWEVGVESAVDGLSHGVALPCEQPECDHQPQHRQDSTPMLKQVTRGHETRSGTVRPCGFRRKAHAACRLASHHQAPLHLELQAFAFIQHRSKLLAQRRQRLTFQHKRLPPPALAGRRAVEDLGQRMVGVRDLRLPDAAGGADLAVHAQLISGLIDGVNEACAGQVVRQRLDGLRGACKAPVHSCVASGVAGEQNALRQQTAAGQREGLAFAVEKGRRGR